MNYRKFRGLSCVLLLMLSLLVSCEDNKQKALSASEAVDSLMVLSPADGARFYMNYKEECDSLDIVYKGLCIPAIGDCCYPELKEIQSILKGTQYEDIVIEYANNKRDDYLLNLKTEINEYIVEEKNILHEEALNALEMDLDSLIQEDVEDILEHYAGGFLNFRKITFIFGRNRNDFKDIFWEDFDTLQYKKKIEEHLKSFVVQVQESQNLYYKELTGKDFVFDFRIKAPNEFTIGLSQSTLEHIQKYTKGESDDILTSVFKDFIAPLAIGAASGGIGYLYEIGNFAYDVKVSIDDIKNEEVDKDDMVKFVCEHDLAYQIRNYYLTQWIEQVDKFIEDSNAKLYQQILEDL